MRIHGIYFMKDKSFSLRLWLFLLFCAFGSLVDVIAFEQAGQSGWLPVAGLVCFAVFKATFLTALYACSEGRRWFRIITVSFIALFVLLSVVNGFSWLFYGFGITRKLIAIASETNPEEMQEFLPELADKFASLFLSWRLPVVAVVIVLLWKFIPLMPRRVFVWITGILSLAGFSYMVYFFATADSGKTNLIICVRTYRCIDASMRARSVIRDLQEKRRHIPKVENVKTMHKATDIVVVIGESASRAHHSLYGYPLSTTPRLDLLADSLYVFTDAVASSTATAENMPRLLSFMTDIPSAGEWFDYPTVLQTFHDMGYHTSWLSNQERTGKWSNLSGILSEDADYVCYVGSQDSEDYLIARHDEALLPEWRKMIAGPDSLRLTFLHLMGSHFQYRNRFPPSRRKIVAPDVLSSLSRPWLDRNKASLIADYDNSILYTDSILSVVIDDVSRMQRPAVLIYLSDHGENVYDDRDYRGRDPLFTEVPFIIYANAAYRRENPDVLADIETALSRPFSTSALPQMLLHLSGSSCSGYDPSADPLSESFRPRTRYVDEEPFGKDSISEARRRD